MWNFCKASTINPGVADLLSLHSAHNRLHKITLSVFYHPRPLNTMADDNSYCFNLLPHPFLAIFCSKYSPWFTGYRNMCHLLNKVLSSVISALCKQPYAAATPTRYGLSPSTPIGLTSEPTYISTTCLRTISSPLSISFRCIDTGSVTVTTPPDPSSPGRLGCNGTACYFQDSPSGGPLRS